MFFRNMELNKIKQLNIIILGEWILGMGESRRLLFLFKFVVAFNFKNGVYVLLWKRMKLKQKQKLPQSHITRKWWGWHPNTGIPEPVLSATYSRSSFWRRYPECTALFRIRHWWERHKRGMKKSCSLTMIRHQARENGREAQLPKMLPREVWVLYSGQFRVQANSLSLREIFNGVQVMSWLVRRM